LFNDKLERTYHLIPASSHRAAVREQLRQSRCALFVLVPVLRPLLLRLEVVLVDVRKLEAIAQRRILAADALSHVGPALGAALEATLIRRVNAFAVDIVDDIAQFKWRRTIVD
jgi:hypothetical protein